MYDCLFSILYSATWPSCVINQLVLQGLIQSVYELHDGSGVVVTIGKYVTPNHNDINGNGVEPDFWRLPGKEFIAQ